MSVFKGLLAVVDSYALASLNNSDHLSIIIFSMLIGGMVALITLNGGMKGIVYHLAKYAKSPRSGQFITWLMGLIIFFDDYRITSYNVCYTKLLRNAMEAMGAEVESTR